MRNSIPGHKKSGTPHDEERRKNQRLFGYAYFFRHPVQEMNC